MFSQQLSQSLFKFSYSLSQSRSKSWVDLITHGGSVQIFEETQSHCDMFPGKGSVKIY